eukprot:sb/3476400/
MKSTQSSYNCAAQFNHLCFSSRVIRRDGEVALRKLVFGRCEKYDGRVRDILKVFYPTCTVIFIKLREGQELSGMAPPTRSERTVAIRESNGVWRRHTGQEEPQESHLEVENFTETRF